MNTEQFPVESESPQAERVAIIGGDPVLREAMRNALGCKAEFRGKYADYMEIKPIPVPATTHAERIVYGSDLPLMPVFAKSTERLA